MIKLSQIKKAFLTGVVAMTMFASSLTALAAGDTDNYSGNAVAKDALTFPVSQTWNTNGVDDQYVDEKVTYKVWQDTTSTYYDEDVTLTLAEETLDGSTQTTATLTASHAGYYTFYIQQDMDKTTVQPGCTYDDTLYKIRAYVKNDGKGGLTTFITAQKGATADEDVDPDSKVAEVVFNNTFTPAHSDDESNDPPVTKIVDGDKPSTSDTFTFVIEADKENPDDAMPENTKVTVSPLSEDESKRSAEFGRITFAQQGTYKYYVREVDEGLKGYTYDTTVYTVTYTVTVNPDTNKLVSSRVFEKDGQEITTPVTEFTYEYTNTYKSSGKGGDDREHHDGGGTGSLMVYKVDAASDNTRLAGVEFEVTKTNGDYVTTITTDSKGMAAIDSLAAGTYRLKEMNTPDGYQSENRYIYVNVLKDTTVASPTNVKVTNTKATTVQHIVAIKQWANVAGVTTPDSVTFTLKKDGVDTGVTQVASAANNWTVDFGLLPADGNYEIVETNVPEDYAVSIEKAVNGTDVVYTITNTYTATESGAAGDHRNGYTGDSSNMALYAGVMAVAAIALAGWFKTTRRSR